MNPVRVRISCRFVFSIALLLIFAASSSALRAQTASIADRLSPSTVFCVQWRGSSFLAGADKKNHVLQFLEDPALAPVWAALTARMQQSARKSAGAIPDTALPDAKSFLENPLVFGLTATPTSSIEPAAQSFSFFMVYDATGKSALIEKWKSVATGEKPPPQVAHYDFAGTSVEVRNSGKDSSYSAQAANYFLVANQKQLIEDLITRFRGADRPAASLSQLPAWQEMRKYIGTDDALEFFGRIPDASEWKIPSVPDAMKTQLAKNLQLEKIHAFGGGVSFAAEATRFHAAVLGDTSPGGPFDLASASKTAFQSQSVVNGSSTFSMSRFDLLAAYQWLRGVVLASVPPQQAAGIPVLEATAQNFLGMPITDALALFTGELAQVPSYSDDGTPQMLYAVTIQKSSSVLRVLRAVLGTKIVAEDSAGSVTYLDIAYPYTDPATGKPRKSMYYAAVTPEWIFAAPQKQMLRQAIARLSGQTSAAPAAGIFANPEFVQMRSRLPEKLSALSASDFTQIPWSLVLAHYYTSLAPQSAKQANPSQPPVPDLLKLVKPDVITQHLHMSLGGWWKDTTGVYFESYIQ